MYIHDAGLRVVPRHVKHPCSSSPAGEPVRNIPILRLPDKSTGNGRSEFIKLDDPSCLAIHRSAVICGHGRTFVYDGIGHSPCAKAVRTHL